MSLPVVIAVLSAVLFSTALSAAEPVAADKAKADAVAAPQADANSAEAKVEASLAKMRELVKARKWNELIQQFKDENISSWVSGFKDKSVANLKAAEAANLRGQAYAGMKDGVSAEKDLKIAVDLAAGKGDYWFALADTYRDLLKDDKRALDSYNKTFECAGKSYGWMPISVTLSAASILMKQEKYDEAFKVMQRYDESDLQQMAPVWGDRMRAANEQINAKLEKKGNSLLVVLAEKGKSEYQIVVPDKYPTPAIGEDMKQVARLLQTAFKANGADLPVVAESARDSAKPGIFLGDTAFSRTNGINISQLKGWSYIQKVIGRDLVIVGNDQPCPAPPDPKKFQFAKLATAKGVTDFLQSYAGTRFLYPDNGAWTHLSNVANVDLLTTPAIEYLPTPKIAVPSNLDIKKTPFMEFDITYPFVISFYHLAQNRFPLVDIDNETHSWNRAIPPDEVTFAAHPEYFALLGGKRVLTGGGAQAQYCISNSEVQELLYKDMERLFKMGFQNVALGQPDGFRGCECEPCKQLFGTGPDWGEKVWILHRKLAERAYKAFPDRIVTISVYAITETLPKTFKSFPPNVRLTLCGTRDFELATWQKFGSPQGFGTYLYYWCPNMMPRYFPMRTPLYVENATKRLMAANVRSITRDGNGGIAYGLEGPTYYTMGRMFDGPGVHTGKNLFNEFVFASFGKSAPAMQSFYDQLYNSLEIYSRYMATREDGWAFQDIYGRGRKHLSTPESIIALLYPMELINSLEKQLALAEKADTSPKVQTRLTLVRREFNYFKSVVNTVHLYNAYQISPDTASLDRLLNSIDALRAGVDTLFTKGNELKGWACPMFPPMGHSANALKLRDDGYQEPYKNSFLNWDTAAKRKASLTNAKRLIAGSAKSPVSIDSPLWDKVQAQPLASNNAANTKPLNTQVRAMSDNANIYLRFDNTLPPGATADAVDKERVEAYLSPAPDSPITYRFTAGLKPTAHAQAARGLIEDLMNLDYGKFDSLWLAEWTHTAIHDPAGNRLTVMMTIPLRSIPQAAVKTNAIWNANFQRVNPAGGAPKEAYVWSMIPGGAGIEDSRGNGELSLSGDGASGSSSAVNPLKVIREKTYKDSFEIPPQWKEQIAKGPLLELTGWRFRADPLEQGVKNEWFKSTNYAEADWFPMNVPSFWGENEACGDLQGYGWHRVAFTVPAEWQGKTLRLMFCSVDEQAWIYLNGIQVGEHSEKSEGKLFTALYDAPFIIDIPPDKLKIGGENVMYVLVSNQIKAGGIWRPVFGCAVDKK
jgi:tetratricopeptide (TPR) repeat protein